MDKLFYIYIMTDMTDSVLYVGIADDLQKTVYRHKNRLTKGFTNWYYLCKLIYYEEAYGTLEAFERERQLKECHREWKLSLVRECNPGLEDLYIG